MNEKTRDLVQTRNPRGGCYVLIDREKGRILCHSPKPFKDVPFAVKRIKHERL